MLQAQDEDAGRQQATESPRGTVGMDAVEEAVSQVMTRMHGIKTSQTTENVPLGPIPTSEIKLDGTLTMALLDTGSPVSIVSLDFFVKTAAANQAQNQSPEEWGEAVRKRIRPAMMSLRSYRGGELAIEDQTVYHLSKERVSIKTTL